MKIIILPTPEEVGRFAAEQVAAVVSAKPNAVVGVATGSSPEALYEELRTKVRDGGLSFAEARAFALDEYVGLPVTHRESYASVVDRQVTVALGFRPDRVRVPDGLAPDLHAAAAQYDDAIRAAGGIDIQILGIGTNGHLGFNEPSSPLTSRTRVTTLTDESRRVNARFFDEQADVPEQSVTQGIGTILEAKALLLVAQGNGKAAALAAAIEGPLSASLPASALQLHANVTVVIDEAAASELHNADYYRKAATAAVAVH